MDIQQSVSITNADINPTDTRSNDFGAGMDAQGQASNEGSTPQTNLILSIVDNCGGRRSIDDARPGFLVATCRAMTKPYGIYT